MLISVAANSFGKIYNTKGRTAVHGRRYSNIVHKRKTNVGNSSDAMFLRRTTRRYLAFTPRTSPTLCISPRIHRICRFCCERMLEGTASLKSTSPTYPQRKSAPSKKSWLRMRFSSKAFGIIQANIVKSSSPFPQKIPIPSCAI